LIRIYNFARGARGVRVAWLCEEMGLDYEVQSLPFPTPADYRVRAPLGRVPFLEDGEAAITESVAMLLYLAQKHGPTPLYPAAGDPALARVLELTVYAEATLGAETNVLLADRFGAPEAEKGSWSARVAAGRVREAVDRLETMLGEAAFLAGDTFTIADIAIGTALGLWRGALGNVLPERLAAYHARLAERPAYIRAQATQSGGG
jgi:glutathione S-transferase